MRCPKCYYLSFEPEPRCKNCGFDLTFEPGDLYVKPADSDEPLADLDLQLVDLDLERREAGAAPALVPLAIEPEVAPAIEPSAPVAAVPAAHAPAPSDLSEESLSTLPASPTSALTAELPLFVQGMGEEQGASRAESTDASLAQASAEAGRGGAASEGVGGSGGEAPGPIDDTPLVTLPRVPRPPLAVRRPTPAPGRVREKYQATAPRTRQIGLLERDLLEADEPHTPARPAPASAPAGQPEVVEFAVDRSAGAVRRLEAAGLDAIFLGGINFAVIWLTLQRLGLTLADIERLPMVPVAALLFLLDALYLLMFTATNGQTIGKMAAGIRVIGAPDAEPADERITLRQAILRALLTFPSVLVLGVGFVPALLGRGPAVHDRFAHTRVVRA
jgi:uncharacterized RDD family membrane protein YckC